MPVGHPLTVNMLVKQARLAAGMTQAQLADATGMSQAYVSTMERGGLTPTLPTLNRVAAATGQTITIRLEPRSAEEEGEPMTATMTPPALAVSARERELRAQMVAEAVANVNLSGVPIDPETRADMDRYARGEIDAETLIADTIARYARR